MAIISARHSAGTRTSTRTIPFFASRSLAACTSFRFCSLLLAIVQYPEMKNRPGGRLFYRARSIARAPSMIAGISGLKRSVSQSPVSSLCTKTTGNPFSSRADRTSWSVISRSTSFICGERPVPPHAKHSPPLRCWNWGRWPLPPQRPHITGKNSTMVVFIIASLVAFPICSGTFSRFRLGSDLKAGRLLECYYIYLTGKVKPYDAIFFLPTSARQKMTEHIAGSRS